VSVDAASAFFERGSRGYSPAATPGRFDGMEPESFGWVVRPLAVARASSSFFEDARLFPPGSVEFDCALLMRRVEHPCHARESLFAGGAARTAA